MPAPTPSNRPLLIAAVSGRALAAAARRAGYRPFVADLFCDLDTVEMAEKAVQVPGALEGGLQAEGLAETLRALVGNEQPEALICASGFEEHPELIEQLAEAFSIAGASGEVVRRTKDPMALAAACAEVGIPFPETRYDRPADPQGWLAKRVGGAGGLHIAPASTIDPAPGIYFQRQVTGTSVSALFMADRDGARVIGFSHQWTSPVPDRPYRYCGAARLETFPQHDVKMIGNWLDALSRRIGLVGLCSADFIESEGTYYLIEINPRPGATLDIFDDEKAPLVAAHLAACRGERAPLPSHHGSMAAMLVYARHDIEYFPPMEWPDWLADRQPPGTRINRGEPICTIFAKGETAGEAKALLLAREAQLQDFWANSREEGGHHEGRLRVSE